MKLVERTINKDIADSINKFIEEIKKNIYVNSWNCFFVDMLWKIFFWIRYAIFFVL